MLGLMCCGYTVFPQGLKKLVGRHKLYDLLDRERVLLFPNAWGSRQDRKQYTTG